jgi:hypothetical protein
MGAYDASGSSEAGIIQTGLEQLFFALWRQPVYRGPGSAPGRYRFSAVNRHGERELVEVEVEGEVGADSPGLSASAAGG